MASVQQPAPAAEGGKLANFLMTIIGIGYLFPIAAIWAAFDYWKMLFPDENIEFIVTGVYQVGSVATVAVLSLVSGFALSPRILFGFGGQFFSLAAILSFRWLTVPSNVLMDMLLGVVLLCSIATGYLDSALLALCSQYSTKMQQSLQIGIGFGTMVSVFYRDITKLFMAGDVENSTCLYFGIAIVTVLICLSCYRLLMRLPDSAHIVDTTGEVAAAKGNKSDVEARGSGSVPLLEGQAKEDDAADDASFRAVWSIVWKNQLTVVGHFVLTTLCYPGLITSVPCRNFLALAPEHWFQTLLLTVFTIFDMVARFLTPCRMGLDHSNIWMTVFLRLAMFPSLMLCVTSAHTSDTISMCVVALYGLMNGFFGSLSLILMNEIPGMSFEQRKTAGRMSACSVNSGLAIGSLLSAGLAYAFDIRS